MNHRLDTDTQVHIYMDEFYCLSNFSAFRVVYHGIDFDTAEHAYQAEKFSDVPKGWIVSFILRTARSAHDAFKLAEKYKHQRRSNWDDIKLDVMRKILRAKLDQHEYVRRKLLETGDRLIVEDSWRDGYWGWGANRDGQNQLGRLWMQIRDEIRRANP